jgi:hypothetical protein
LTGDRFALVVAVEEYDDPTLRRLSAPMADAEALAGVLGDSRLGGFAVDIVRNERAASITERIEDFLSDRSAGDTAVLHFSCHGLKDDSGELYLAARNTVPTRLASTAVDAALVDRLMRRSRAKSIVLLLDCCYGGAFERGTIARAGGSAAVGEHFHQEALGAGRGRAVITASTAMEYAFEGSDLATGGDIEPSMFTGALVEGIRTGDADRDGDGDIALGELYEWVYDAVRARSPRQTPCKWEYGIHGELVIARAPARRVRPGPLSPAVAELTAHPHAAVRRSAVTELAGMASSTDLPAAAAARRALQTLSEDDSRSVAAAAAEALNETRLRVSDDAVSFGALAQGEQAVVRTVTLLGPALTTAAEVSATHPSLQPRLLDRTLEIAVDTTAEGQIDATVLVQSSAGDAHISVTATVRRAAAVTKPDVSPAATLSDFETPRASAPAGWYPDPHGYGPPRFWDGAAWTERRSPQVPPVPPKASACPDPKSSAAPQVPARGTSSRWSIAAMVLGVLGVLLFPFGMVAVGLAVASIVKRERLGAAALGVALVGTVVGVRFGELGRFLLY